MDALVVYESMFGNGRTVARAIGAGLGRRAAVEVVEVGAAPTTVDADLVVVGGPTHQFGLTTPDSRREAAQQATSELVSAGIGLREWLAQVEPGRASVAATTYDTRMERPRFLQRVDRTARIIEKRLGAGGFRTISTPHFFYVLDVTGPLREGERERALRWGAELADLLAAIVGNGPPDGDRAAGGTGAR